QRGARDVSALDEDLTEPLAGRLLRREGVLELLRRQQPLLHEERAKRTPRHACRSHRCDFGLTAAGLEPIGAPTARLYTVGVGCQYASAAAAGRAPRTSPKHSSTSAS